MELRIKEAVWRFESVYFDIRQVHHLSEAGKAVSFNLDL